MFRRKLECGTQLLHHGRSINEDKSATLDIGMSCICPDDSPLIYTLHKSAMSDAHQLQTTQHTCLMQKFGDSEA